MGKRHTITYPLLGRWLITLFGSSLNTTNGIASRIIRRIIHQSKAEARTGIRGRVFPAQRNTGIMVLLKRLLYTFLYFPLPFYNG